MKAIIFILILLGPLNLFSQFDKSFTNVKEYRFSNQLAEAVRSESYNYGIRMLDSVMVYTDLPDKAVIKYGITCCLKTYKKEKLQKLIKIAITNHYSLHSLKEEVGSLYPEIIKSNTELFSFRMDSVRLFLVAEQLAQMLVDDQVSRTVYWEQIVNHSKKLGYSVTVDHEKSGYAVDSTNIVLLDSILNLYPDLSKEDVGSWGMKTIFAVIQHTSHLGKYKQLMERWYKNGDIPASDFAYYTDGLLWDQGKPQIYGTQLTGMGNDTFFDEIEDIDSIEKNRMKMGLESIERYARSFGIDWSEYVKSQ